MSWKTKHEIEFLKNLGSNNSHSDHRRRSELSRKELLERYIEAANLRADWGKINKKVALMMAHKFLANL